jgi:hypothetical protein
MGSIKVAWNDACIFGHIPRKEWFTKVSLKNYVKKQGIISFFD